MVSKINTPANSNIYSVDDCVIPFQIDTAHITGRMIRCQKSISRILNQHNYPVPVARLLGEALLLVVLLGSGMKLKHRMILQIKGDGALPLLVADYYADGSMRGYVECKDDLYQKWTGGETINPFLLIGKGHLAITVDNGDDTKPYQGIVPIQGESLSVAILAYIEGSDQIMSALKLYITQKDYNGTVQWFGAAMLIQKLGKAGNDFKTECFDNNDDETWTRIKALFHTLSDSELCDAELSPDRLLFRLFHEEGVRIFEKSMIHFECKCDMSRLEAIFKNSDPSDLQELADENGIIEANCQFCENKYHFSLKDI
jgi:molecular chaperone Hsp33